MPASKVVELIQAGLTLHQAGRLDEAAASYRQAIAIDPNHWDPPHLLGLIAHQQGRHSEAADWIAKAVKLRPREAGFWFNYGNVLSVAGRTAEAITAFQSAVEIQPDFLPAWVNLFGLLQKSNHHDEAAATAQTIAKQRPENADDHLRLGIALYCAGRFGQAVTALQEAIKLRSGFFPAEHELALALAGLGKIDEAIAILRDLLTRPQNTETCKVHSNLLLTLQYSDRETAAEIFTEHLRWARQYADPITPIKSQMSPIANKRLRIGYVSGDFRSHPVGRFMLPVLANHDRGRFEVFCYHNSNISDEIATALSAASDHWRPIHDLSDDAAATMIRKDQIDLLIDLSGHTNSDRLMVFARKPAPAAATWLGYPGTTGMVAIDFRVTDAFADPPGTTEIFHREKLVRLPRSFLCFAPPADAPEVSPVPALSAGHVTFGSFNQSTKISPTTQRLWASVLAAVPNSRLLLKANGLMDAQTREQLIIQFEKLGIARSRVEIVPVEIQHRDHLAKYSRIDIALDTFPYHGTTTTCDALWMGMPTLTLAGSSHVSRVGASLLSNAGLPQWIAQSQEEYLDKAIAFAGDIAALASLRQTLRDQLRSSSLMDTSGFVKDLEAAFLGMF